MRHIIIFFILILASISAGEVAIEKVKLQLQWKHQFEFAGFYAAKEKGFYRDAGLDVELLEYDSGESITSMVLDGDATYGVTYASIVAEYLNGKPLVMMANFFKQSPLVLIAQEEISTPVKLKGKRVMGVSDSIDSITLVSMLQKFNITTKNIQNIAPTFNIQDFIDKKVDAMGVFTTNELYELNKRGVKYNLFDPTVYGTKYYDVNLFTTQKEATSNPQRVRKFKEASIKGWKYALANQDEMIEIILDRYNTQNKTREALAFEAKQIEQIMMPSVYEVGSIDKFRIETIAGNFRQSGFIKNQKDIGLDTFIFGYNSNPLGAVTNNSEDKVKLTREESLYLKKKKEIKMCVDPDWMPFERVEDGKYYGLASDYMKMFSQQINTPISLTKTKSWAESLKKIENRECDILPMAEKTESRERYMDFTKPYIDLPVVVATRTGIPFIDNILQIKEKKLGVVKGYSLIERLIEKYPDINLVEVSSMKDGLEKVENGTIFGYIDNAASINYAIEERYIGIIAISGKFDSRINLSVATRNDEKILNQIFEKLVSSIDIKTKHEISNRWINISYADKVDYTPVWQILTISFLVILFFLYRYIYIKRVMQKEINSKTKELKDMNLNLEETIEQRVADAKLIRDRFQLAIDGANDGLWDRDLITEQVYYSPRFKEQIGYVGDEIGTDIDEWVSRVHPDDIDNTVTDVNNYFQGVTELYENEHRLKHKDGSWIWVLSRAKALFDADGEPIRLVGFHTDITRKKELEENLQQLVDKKTNENIKQREVLQQQSKLTAMGEMIGNIAHQWRQPLAQINSAVLILDDEILLAKASNSLIDSKLDEIESTTTYMSETIDDFKNFYKEDKQKRLFSIQKSIETAVSLVAATLKYNYIDISKEFDSDTKIRSFKNEFEQVVLILVNNARDVLLSRKTIDPIVVLKVENMDNICTVSISDNAGGVEESIINKIFEPYFTTKHKSQGTGLGLYLSKVIIEENMGGRLYVENHKDGACFKIELCRSGASVEYSPNILNS